MNKSNNKKLQHSFQWGLTEWGKRWLLLYPIIVISMTNGAAVPASSTITAPLEFTDIFHVSLWLKLIIYN